jgi:5-methylcytosine-specific restriction endonuclease McrA
MEKRRELRKKMGGESHSFKEWLDLKTEYQYSCAHCGSSEPEIKLTRDHIVPLSKGGTDGIDNIQPLCLACNMSKGTKIFAYAGNQSGS